MKKIPLLFILLLAACTSSNDELTIKTAAKKTPSDLIKSATLLSYSELDNVIKQKVPKTATKHPYNWNEGEQFDPTNAFYVKAIINVQLLVKFSSSASLTKDYLLSNKPNGNYGKYLNSWHFYAGNNEIVKTDKFCGFNILDVSRTGNFDIVYFGPIPDKPEFIEFESRGDNFTNYRFKKYVSME